MMSSGLYNYSGPWICNVGLPGKSGVGGGIIAILPGYLAIGIVSPRLDEHGNSVRGVAASIELSKLLNLNMFNSFTKCTSDIKKTLKFRKRNIKKKFRKKKLTVKSKNLSYKIDPDLFKSNIKSREKIKKIVTKKKR